MINRPEQWSDSSPSEEQGHQVRTIRQEVILTLSGGSVQELSKRH
jgi:hypothetical protein